MHNFALVVYNGTDKKSGHVFRTYILVLSCVEVEKYTITKLAFVLLQHCGMMRRRLNEKDKTNQRRSKNRKAKKKNNQTGRKILVLNNL